MGPQPRFRAGIASATVPIAPVTAQLTAQSNAVACGQSTQLNWNSANAVDTSVNNLGSVPANGDRSVSPMQTTTYELTAKGPGGTASQSATVSVDTQPTATLNLIQPEVRYHKIGDKVVEQDSTTLNWTTSNGDAVTITPLGPEAASGSQTILASPKQESVGAINEEVPYTLRTSNACGGTATQTATLHIVGSIDPQPEVVPPAIALASLFYPTDYPKSNHAQIGLVASEQQKLNSAASQFKVYEQYDHMATLVVVGQADIRGPENYNQALSQRRAERVKSYLVSQGIAGDKIQTRADGKDKQLDKAEVLGLQSADSQKPEKWMSQRPETTWLAYNRRVDIILMPGGQQSTKAYPNDASDARVLWERTVPSLKAVESASQGKPGNEQAQVRNSAR
jgi:OmpA family